MEQVQDGSSNLALLAGVPGVLHCQQLLWLQPLLQVVYQLLTCSSMPIKPQGCMQWSIGENPAQCALWRKTW